ncbi:hypothetical protein ABZ915_01765 [Streptomyces sp. NPDC046915]|uniref:hypothetical protein n=1 Tax=Streptomyces sp. NPDC046915 TaxID=3155257 RepID=UPI003408E9BF
MAELTPGQRALAEVMSEVSELAYRAGWMRGCEFDVWRLLHEGGNWGMADAEQLAPLLAEVRAARDRAGCWIVWGDDDPGEQAVPLAEWLPRYETWAASMPRGAR